MATLAASVIASMVIDDMLKDDSGKEVDELMGDGYKGVKQKFARHLAKMGSVLVRSAAKVALKKCGKLVTKQALKRLALKGAKVAAKSALQAGAGLAADAALRKMSGNGMRKKRRTGYSSRKRNIRKRRTRQR